MIIQLKGGSFKNKGDELMLRAVVDRFAAFRPRVKLASYAYTGTYEQRAALGLYQTLWAPDPRRLSGVFGYPVIKRYRRGFGIVTEGEVEVLLDLAGYCYSDHWGPANTVHMARYMRKLSEKGVKFVLLPQAFGPFTRPETRAAFREMIPRASLVFARDLESYEHIASLDVELDRVHVAPDFTNLMAPIVPRWCVEEGAYGCIVPNKRMMDQTSRRTSGLYLEFLAEAIRRLSASHVKPLLVLHEIAEDVELIEPLRKAAGYAVPCVLEEDPVVLRGILGRAHVVVGSRYHALVGALSQGVPAVGTTWSHKYAALFADYGCPENLLTSLDDREALTTTLARILDTDGHARLRRDLARAADEMRRRTREMWRMVGDVIGLRNLEADRNGTAPSLPVEDLPARHALGREGHLLSAVETPFA